MKHMNQLCWQINKDTGFLMNPDPISDLSKANTPLANDLTEHLQKLSETLPELIHTQQLRPTLIELPVYDMSPLLEVEDLRVHERAFQIYAHFANAFVWCEEKNPTNYIPKGVAVPLVELAKMVERPPIVPYATTALSNFQRVDPQGAIEADNLKCVQKLIDIPDESWFHLIHVEIESHAGSAVQACLEATNIIGKGDTSAVEAILNEIPTAVNKMSATFKRITEKCSPDVYYHTLRPYLFGFDDIVYEGVEEFKGEPQTFRGETGAQSSVIPTLQNFLGLHHEQGGLSKYLEIMKDYMPKPHRELLASINTGTIREFVIEQKQAGLNDVYNECLESIVDFRSLHLHMAQAYIANKVKNPTGTGGTDFMRWLKQLRDETAQQYIK